MLLLLGLVLVHKVASIGVWIWRQHAAVVLLLGTVDRLREGRGGCGIDSSICGVEVLLIVELKVQAQSIIVVVHDVEGRSSPGGPLACSQVCLADLTGMSANGGHEGGVSVSKQDCSF